jgi:hypothetical protein
LFFVSILFLEFVYSPFRVDVFLLPGKKGMTLVADFDIEGRLSGPGSEGIPAGAGYLALHIFGMYLLFHRVSSTLFQGIECLKILPSFAGHVKNPCGIRMYRP